MSCLIRPSNVRVYQFRHLGRCLAGLCRSPGRGGTEGGTRTHTTLRPLVPETSASTIPPPRPDADPARPKAHRSAARRHASTSQYRSPVSAMSRRRDPSRPRVTRSISSRPGERQHRLTGSRAPASSAVHAATRSAPRAGLRGRPRGARRAPASWKPDEVRPGGPDLARGEQRVEVGLEAHRDVDDGRRERRRSRSRSADERRRPASRRSVTVEADRRPVAHARPRPTRRPPGSPPPARLSISSSYGAFALGVRPSAPSFVLPAGLERAPSAAARVVGDRPARPSRRTAHESAGSSVSAARARRRRATSRDERGPGRSPRAAPSRTAGSRELRVAGPQVEQDRGQGRAWVAQHAAPVASACELAATRRATARTPRRASPAAVAPRRAPSASSKKRNSMPVEVRHRPRRTVGSGPAWPANRSDGVGASVRGAPSSGQDVRRGHQDGARRVQARVSANGPDADRLAAERSRRARSATGRPRAGGPAAIGWVAACEEAAERRRRA